MAKPVKIGKWADPELKEYYLDTADNMADINTEECAAGSIVYLINTGVVYMLNENKEWKEQ